MASQEDSGAVEKSAIPSEVVDCIRVVVNELLEQRAAARGGGSGGTSLSGTAATAVAVTATGVAGEASTAGPPTGGGCY